MRICHLNNANSHIKVGIYACSPEKSSFKATFTDFILGPCLWGKHQGQAADIVDLNMLDLAIDIASKAHEGQLDTGGNKYIEHPLRVSKTVNNINEKIVAVLHDTLEDTKITKDDLINYGFNKEIIDAIITITKKADEDYNDYISRIKLNNLAKTVKIADILDNLNFSRLKEINSDDIKRNIKYLNTLKKLLY